MVKSPRMGVLAACRIAKRFCDPQKNPRMDFLVLDNKVESPWMGGLATQRFVGQISDPGKNPRMDFFRAVLRGIGRAA